MRQDKPVSLALGIVVLLIVLLLVAVLMTAYINAERDREMQQWQSRLGLVAQAKADVIGEWLSTRNHELNELAANASLQFYLSRLQSSNSAAAGAQAPAAETQYLNNLLRASAIRYGYAAADGERLPASISQTLVSGLALFDINGKLVSVSADAPDILGNLQTLVEAVLADGQSKNSEFLALNARTTAVALAVPVFSSLGATGDAGTKPLGVVVGLRSLSGEVFGLLDQGSYFTASNKLLLMEKQAESLQLLSSSPQGARLEQANSSSDDTPIAAELLAGGAQSMVSAPDSSGHLVLAAARQVFGQPWWVVQQVSADEALYDGQRRQRYLWWTLAFALLSLAGLAFAAWRHGRGIQSQRLAGEMQAKASELQQQTDLLHAITDSIDTHALLLDEQQRVFFANRPLIKAVEEQHENIDHKSLSSLLGAEAATALLDDVAAKRCGHVMPIKHGNIDASYQVNTVALERVGTQQNPVLLTLTDVTALQAEQAAHSTTLRGIINTLVDVVDSHDPYSAHHSERVEVVAAALGQELQLATATLTSLKLAARLSNVGKIKLPTELLIRTNDLTEEEHQQLQQHVEYGLELLRGLNLGDQVLGIIAQKQELLDGSGYPQGLSDAQMDMPGKILSVANAFVALLSPRAYRAGLPADEAMDYLMQLSGSKYDRQVLAALLHVLENRQLDAELQHLA